ncbi:MAG: phosphate ABC transporter substrate-binding protein [Lachnospiraceae bacterium]|uniref:phosphate ABC transporter substrate-binding protein n=1 Tax=uncultured Acetatifactor sp. TaxID=1671927 RepID=UPI00263325AD|nr:phosphate ABC transporter substrate-binding protein [uncultured Acetatifactor sp.]MCI8790209.1 phosphate ABC transporter substrate-binding protein [Lachnospiraceae bacterium]
MGKRIYGRLGMLAVFLLLAECVGCGGEPERATGAAPELVGSLRLEGSSSMEKAVDGLAEGFMEQYPEVAVTVQFTGSGAGIEAVAEGRAEIGNSSRNLTEEERARGLTENVAAIDGIAVCVDAFHGVRDVTKKQLADIYTGRITNWAALGGEDLPIVVIGREAGSGTREAFETLLGIGEQCTYANELDSTGAVMARIASTPGAIGYVSFDMVETDGKGRTGQNVMALRLDGVEAEAENVRNGSYPLCRPFLMITRGEVSAQEELVQAWFRYVFGEKGREIMTRAGLVMVEKGIDDLSSQ